MSLLVFFFPPVPNPIPLKLYLIFNDHAFLYPLIFHSDDIVKYHMTGIL